jgi:hypothetical protein
VYSPENDDVRGWGDDLQEHAGRRFGINTSLRTRVRYHRNEVSGDLAIEFWVAQ